MRDHRRLWEPSTERVQAAALTRFADHSGRPGASYDELWRWSVSDLRGFWAAASRFLGVRWRRDPTQVLGRSEMPGAEWFPGGRLSFPEHVFTDRAPNDMAIRFRSEALGDGSWTWADLLRETARIRSGLMARGVTKGDRVAAYLPNIPQAIAAMLATTSIGAIWSAAPPEFGVEATVSRFAQIRPKVLLGVDGYRYKGRSIGRTAEVRQIAEQVSAELIRFGLLDRSLWADGFLPPDESTADARGLIGVEFADVDFDHPLWVLYSSGTTGPPKAIVHGHGGVLLELLKTGVLQLDLRPDDRFFWYTTTGWVMWNILFASLLAGGQAVLYDGHHGIDALWDTAAATGTTFFGCGAAWLDGNRRAGYDPTSGRDLSALRAIGSTGSPLPGSAYDWVYETLPATTWLVSISGGTDIVTPFLGAVPTVPVYHGELGPAALGVDLQAWSPSGHPVVGEVGEMVITQPMPSMPLTFIGDVDGSRLRDSYFARFPGVWTHGDWLMLTDRGTGVIQGRSDATLNRGGVRIGTAEIYRAIEGVPGITDSVAVEVPRDGDDGEIVLFVVTEAGVLDAGLENRIRNEVRTRCSPRHVPDKVVAVRDLPRTSSGKKLEVPIKRLLMGAPIDSVVNRGTLANPETMYDLLDAAARADVPCRTAPNVASQEWGRVS